MLVGNRQMAEESGSTSGAVVRVPADVAPYIDHTLLKPEATREQINHITKRFNCISGREPYERILLRPVRHY